MRRFLPVIALLAVSPLLVAQTPPSVVLKWNPVTTLDDGTPIAAGVSVSYKIYGGHSSTGPWSASINVQTVSSVRTNVAIGVDCYYVTAVVNSVESLPSDVACITVAAPVSTVPSKPLNLSVVQQ